MPRSPAIALLTDFGTSDGYVGVMKGVALGIARGVALIDVTHDIPPQDVPAGAWVLHTAWRYFPQDTVFLCVVDPGVGSERRPVALRCGGSSFVGPDNGLFSYVLAAEPAVLAVELENPGYQLPTPSATFHGRDIFAPAAAHLADGIPLDSLGPRIDPASLITFPLPGIQQRGDRLIAEVVHIDRFGNVITSCSDGVARAVLDLPQSRLLLNGRGVTARSASFAGGPESEPFLYLDSSGYLGVAVRNGSAQAMLAAVAGMTAEITGFAEAPAPRA